jgi:hypothetical protein
MTTVLACDETEARKVSESAVEDHRENLNLLLMGLPRGRYTFTEYNRKIVDRL